MTLCKTMILAGLSAVAAMSLGSLPAEAKSVLMISIDGMNSEYVTEAQARGLNVPNLRRFMVEGSYATGVKGVTPSISWPSAATLMTGTPPARHGVLSNARFEPSDRNRPEGIYYYAADIKADTLWEAADRAGLVTANVDQLGTVGSMAIRYDIPRYEPSPWYPETLKALDAVSRPPGLLAELQARLGTYNGFDFSTEGYDTTRARFAIEILQRYKPQFMTVHLSGVDVEAHAHAPYSPQSKRAAEEIDGLVGQLRAAALANDPDAIVAIVSDHGQAPATRVLNLRIPFVEAGLIEIEPPVAGRPVRIADWKADLWRTAAPAVMLRDPADTASRTRVREVLTRLAADPANGILRILEGAEIVKLEGFPDAAFVVDMKPGVSVGGDLIGTLTRDLPLPIGVHGYLPDHPEMNAAFFIAGKGVRAGQNLGLIDMVQIAPTLAQAMGVRLLDATAPVLPVFSAQP
jgi:predicted AlkP superfamily pyrophosphatase or phosphodiesterase